MQVIPAAGPPIPKARAREASISESALVMQGGQWMSSRQPALHHWVIQGKESTTQPASRPGRRPTPRLHLSFLMFSSVRYQSYFKVLKPCHCPKVGGGGGEPLARAGQWLSCPTVTCRHSCLPRMEAEHIAGEMTAPNITFGLRCLLGVFYPRAFWAPSLLSV